MPFQLDRVVPWGRTLKEYTEMFGLTNSDLSKKIAGFGDGPASFQVEWTQKGGRVISFDPIYRYTAQAIRQRILETRDVVMEQTRQNMHHYNWERFGTLRGLEQARMAAMERFLSDFEQGKADGRYVYHELPQPAPFPDGAFDLGLSSHFLLLYPQLGLKFHLRSIREMLRLCREVRIFPLLDLDGQRSACTDEVLACFGKTASVEIVQSTYEFLKGANQMLVLRHR